MNSFSLGEAYFPYFRIFPRSKKVLPKKTKFSISGGASSFRGDSRDILECPGSGIRFITITPIFGQKSANSLELEVSKLGSDRNFGSVRGSVDFGRFGSVRQKFCRTFAEFFVIQFHAHLQYTGIKRTDYAILCNK